MIPKSIADKLRNGVPPLNTCQEYDSVSILFSDIVSFTPMCSRLSAMNVVCVLNAVCTAYDKLCVKHRVYKVVTAARSTATLLTHVYYVYCTIEWVKVLSRAYSRTIDNAYLLTYYLSEPTVLKGGGTCTCTCM